MTVGVVDALHAVPMEALEREGTTEQAVMTCLNFRPILDADGKRR